MKLLYVTTAFTLIFSAFAPLAQGQESTAQVIISEINWSGSASSNADEWVELYNTSSEEVDLSGWILAGAASGGDALSIEDGTAIAPHETLIISNYELGNEKTTLDIAPNLTTTSLSLSNTTLELMLIMPDGAVVNEVTLEQTASFGSSNPHASMEFDLVTLEWQTATESINLLDQTQFGTPGITQGVVEEVEVIEEETLPPCTPNDQSDQNVVEVELPEPIENNEIQNAEQPEPLLTSPSKGEEPETLTSFAPKTLIINEVVSDPEDGDEWIEIFNPSNGEIYVEDWSIVEGSGKSTALPNQTLGSNGFLIIENPSGSLNNGGDNIQLLDPSENIIDEVEYGTDTIEAPEKGESLALNSSDSWEITSLITKGVENEFDSESDQVVEWSGGQDNVEVGSPDPVEENIQQPEPLLTSPLEGEEPDEANTEPEVVEIVAIATSNKSSEPENKTSSESSSAVSMAGAVTAVPGTFGNQIAFIQGMQVYFYHADWPAIALGDVIAISGEPSQSRGEDRIKISSIDDIEIVGSIDLKPETVTTDTIDNVAAGTLVQISGSAVARDGDKLTLKDDNDEILIVAHSATNISWTDTLGEKVAITGIVRVFDGVSKIYPRSASDIKVETSSESLEGAAEAIGSITNSKNSNPWLGGALITACAGTLAYWYIRNKKLRRA